MKEANPFDFDEAEELVNIERTKKFGENLVKNFPNSFANRHRLEATFSYTVPKSYLETAFWEQIASKLGQWRRDWLEYQRRLVMVQDENISPRQLDLAQQSLEKLTDSYDVLMQLDHSEKENENSKIPVDLWNELWNELHEKDKEARDLCSRLSADLTGHLNFETFNWPADRVKTAVKEKVKIKQEVLSALEEIKKKMETLREVGPVHEAIVENVLEIWHTVTSISADTEDQEDMLSILVGLLEKNKTISSKEYREIREGIEELVVECSSMTDTSAYKHLPPSIEELLGPKKIPPPRREVTKESQDYDFDVSQSRAKRDRRPKKVFSPLYTPNCTPPPGDGRNGEPTASSSESDEDSRSDFGLNGADAESDDQEEFIVDDELIEDEDEPPKKRHRGPDNQPVPNNKTTEAELMMLEQSLYLEETKLQLLGCRVPNGNWSASYLPLLLEMIDKAIASLAGKENPVQFVMYRAAVEEGVARFIEETRDPENANKNSSID